MIAKFIAICLLLPFSACLQGCSFESINGQLAYTDAQGNTISGGTTIKLRNFSK